MAYTPYYAEGWKSGEDGGTPITPAALNNMEAGIRAANGLGDPVAVAHGGTGATTPSGARRAIAAAHAVELINTDTNWAAIYAKLSGIDVGSAATIRAGNNASGFITNGKITYGFTGVAGRIDAGTFDFIVKNASASYQNYIYVFRVSDVTAGGGSPGTVYRFEGAAI